MKTKNAVVGSTIEVKRTFTNTASCDEHFEKGLQVLVADNNMGEYQPLKVVHKDIEDGYAWVNPKHFRKVKEVVEEVSEAPTEHLYKVDDKVLVGAEGAGFGYVDCALANKVCTVTALRDSGCLRIEHPSVLASHGGYLTYPCYVSPYAAPEPEPVRPEVGDWVVATAVNPHLVAGVAYKVVGFSAITGCVGIALNTHQSTAWQKVHYINTEDYSIVLREVKPDADTHT